jgi:hypothetical protein
MSFTIHVGYNFLYIHNQYGQLSHSYVIAKYPLTIEKENIHRNVSQIELFYGNFDGSSSILDRYVDN